MGDEQIQPQHTDKSQYLAELSRRFPAFDFGYETVADARQLGDASLRKTEGSSTEPDRSPEIAC